MGLLEPYVGHDDGTHGGEVAAPASALPGSTVKFKRLSDVDVRGKRVFIRADLNVPQDDAGNITDDMRIRASVPAIRDALSRGAAGMVTSHLGRPTEGVWKAEDSLAPIGRRLSELLGIDIPLVRDLVGGGGWQAGMHAGEIVR